MNPLPLALLASAGGMERFLGIGEAVILRR